MSQKKSELYERTQQRIAECVIGPRFDVPASSQHSLQGLRKIKWEKAQSFERQDALTIAASIMREFHLIPRKTRVGNLFLDNDKKIAAHYPKRAKKDAGKENKRHPVPAS